jgi:uncharacterized protein Yka (UPF0111/DUF47 family)
MTAAIGLERLPRRIAAALDEAAANLVASGNRLDELVHGDRTAREAISRSESEGDRIFHDLVAAVGGSRRDGPHRAALIELGQAVDDIVDAVDDLACAWAARGVGELGDLLLAVRDGVRDAGHALAAIQQPSALAARLARCREHDDDIRRLSRNARAWLLVEQSDPQLALRGHDLVEHADSVEIACVRLRERLDTYALA